MATPVCSIHVIHNAPWVDQEGLSFPLPLLTSTVDCIPPHALLPTHSPPSPIFPFSLCPPSFRASLALSALRRHTATGQQGAWECFFFPIVSPDCEDELNRLRAQDAIGDCVTGEELGYDRAAQSDQQVREWAAGGEVRVGKQQVRMGKQQVRVGKQQVRVGKQQVRVGKQQVRMGKQQVRVGKQQVRVGKQQVRVGKQQVRVGKQQVCVGKQQVLGAAVCCVPQGRSCGMGEQHSAVQQSSS
ncbi:unnamed protein product [Closterium sp. NIES-53]